MYSIRKASWLLALGMWIGLAGYIPVDGSPVNMPDSLFNRVNLDTLPVPPAMENIWNTISNRPYNKAIQPVQVKKASQHLLQDTSLTLSLPGKANLEFVQERVIWRDSSNYQWRGYSHKDSTALKIVVRGERLTGTILSDTASYRIQPLGDIIGPANRVNNIHVITRMDPSGLNLTDSAGRSNDLKKDEHPKKSQVNESRLLNAEEEIDHGIMVVYSDEVADEVADPEGLVQSAVSDANNAYENSGIPVNLTLVHSREISYNESSDTDTDLRRLQDSTDGFIDEVHDYRDEYGADVVVLLTANTQSDETGTVTGEAYEIMADTSTAFAVVRYDFAEAPVYTLAHEVGHLQGADHNPEDEINPHEDYGHGYTYPDGEWRTIMAYNVNSCCSRIGFFSTPDVTYNGDPLGTDAESDNARVLTETASTIADFRPPFPLEVLISGPSTVRAGGRETWIADVSGGVKPYSHTWYRRESEDELWRQIGQGDTLEQVVEQYHQLRLESTDETDKTKSSDVFHVYTPINSDLEKPSEGPAGFRLYPNYPNPFNPSTEITYDLHEAAHVKIEVYSLNGHRIQTLVDQLQSRGTHRMTYTADNLSSGLYMLRMKARSKGSGQVYRRTIKMTLLK